jgi:CheY-like chemotaxis protein
LRSRPQHAALPVFVWTAVSLSADEQRALARSAQAVIAKGDATLDQVVLEIVQWLRGSVHSPRTGA